MAPVPVSNSFEVRAQNGLRKREVARFLKVLKEKKEKILDCLRQPMECIGVHGDPNDHSSVQTDREFENCNRRRQSAQMRDIDSAIARISAGEFGICHGDTPEFRMENEDCTGLIELSILKTSPVARLCSHCTRELKERTQSSGKRKPAEPQLPIDG